METCHLLKKLRADRKESYRALAAKAGISFTSVWRAETAGFPLVRIETLTKLLLRGYKLKEESKMYKDVMAAWTRDRVAPLRKGAKSLEQKIASLSKDQRAELEQFLKTL